MKGHRVEAGVVMTVVYMGKGTRGAQFETQLIEECWEVYGKVEEHKGGVVGGRCRNQRRGGGGLGDVHGWTFVYILDKRD